MALRDVQQEPHRRWAISAADYRNAHRPAHVAPWSPEDFTDSAGRARRAAQYAADRAEVALLNVALARIQPGYTPSGVELPEWARN